MRLFVCVFAFSALAGCAETAARAPVTVTYNAAAPTATVASSSEAPSVSASTGAIPPAPTPLPPSAYASVEVELEGNTVQVKGGEVFSLDRKRMLFFYPKGALSDCANVAVQNLVKRPNIAGICQIGFMPIAQGLKQGDELDAGIAVSKGVPVTFKLKVL